MNTVQRATFAASALAITLVGAVLVTAPLLFARGALDHRLARTPASSVTS